MKIKQFLKPDKRKLILFFMFVFILFMFHVILFVLATAQISGTIHSIAYAYISVPLLIMDSINPDPIFYGTPLWLMIFYLLTIIYLYLLSYFIIWVYDNVKKKLLRIR